MAAGTAAQVQALIDANLIPTLLKMLSTEEYKVKKEAAWAINNLASSASREQAGYLVRTGCVKPVCDLLETKDAEVVKLALDTCSHLLKLFQADDGSNELGDLIEEAGGLDTIEDLQNHDNQDVYEKALTVIETFFPADDEDEDESALGGGGGGFGSGGFGAGGGFGGGGFGGGGFGGGGDASNGAPIANSGGFGVVAPTTGGSSGFGIAPTGGAASNVPGTGFGGAFGSFGGGGGGGGMGVPQGGFNF